MHSWGWLYGLCTLGVNDIDNHADFETRHQSAGLSTGGNLGSQFVGNLANSVLAGVHHDEHANSRTHAAVSDGTLTLRAQPDIARLSRDVEHANPALSPIFDPEKEQRRLQEAQLIGEIGNQAMDIARTEGKIAALHHGKAALKAHGTAEPTQDASQEEWQAYHEKLVSSEAYKATEATWGTGSPLQQGMQAATAAIQGLAGGNLQAAVAGGRHPIWRR